MTILSSAPDISDRRAYRLCYDACWPFHKSMAPITAGESVAVKTAFRCIRGSRVRRSTNCRSVRSQSSTHAQEAT